MSNVQPDESSSRRILPGCYSRANRLWLSKGVGLARPMISAPIDSCQIFPDKTCLSAALGSEVGSTGQADTLEVVLHQVAQFRGAVAESFFDKMIESYKNHIPTNRRRKSDEVLEGISKPYFKTKVL